MNKPRFSSNACGERREEILEQTAAVHARLLDAVRVQKADAHGAFQRPGGGHRDSRPETPAASDANTAGPS